MASLLTLPAKTGQFTIVFANRFGFPLSGSKRISEIVEKHKDKLGVNTPFRNIVKVNAAWAEDKSARE